MKLSSFISAAPGRSRGEIRYYLGFCTVLALGSLLLLAVPAFNPKGAVSFAASWLLLISSALAILRPAFYRRGLPDLTEGLITAFFYGFCSFAAGETAFFGNEGYRLALCAVMLFMGFSHLLVFSRMLSVTPLPLHAAASLIDGACAVLLVLGIPNAHVYTVFWYAGMLLLVDAATIFSEALALKKRFS